MFCPSCGAAAQPSQKFCTECGASIAAAPAPGAPTLPPPNLAPPVAPTPSVTPPVTPPAGADLYEPTAALTVVEQTSPVGYDSTSWNTVEPAWPAGGDTTGELGVAPTLAAGAAVEPFRITPLVAVSALAAVLAVAAAFVDIASVDVTESVAPKAEVYNLNYFSSNLTVGAIIAAVLLVAGSALGATGRRVGTGLAGGAGLALAGMMGMVIGQVTQVFDGAEIELILVGGTLTTTQEIGFWLAVVAAALGGLAFVLSLSGGKADGRPPLNPAIGVLGALGTLAVVVGPLIPQNGAGFGDNFSNEFIPPATLYLRVLVVVLIGVGGLVGFLANRRWGIGMALGAISIGAWQWLTAITESGEFPLGIAGGNFFPKPSEPYAPHLVTTIGVVVMLLAGVAGLLVASQQRNA